MAFRTMGRDLIPYLLIEEMDDNVAQVIELEENLKRIDLTWQEKVQAYETVHQKLSTINEEWSQEQTATRLGISPQSLSFYLVLGDGMRKNPDLEKANTASTAYNMIKRETDRHLDDIATSIAFKVRGMVAVPTGLSSPSATTPSQQNSKLKLPEELIRALPQQVADTVTKSTPAAPRQLQYVSAEQSLICGDFMEWAKTYRGPRFNFIHCDFPYGAGMNKPGSQTNAGKSHQTYEDSPVIFWQLCDALCQAMSNVIAPSAHIMMWFQTSNWAEVLDYWKECSEKYDLTVFDVPMIWTKSDGASVVSDASRRYRHNYETAFLISRGDRKIIRTTSDVVSSSVARDIHPSEKPEGVLRHFFQALVSNTTRMFDPTAGSGNALIQAEALGAEFVFGLEKDEGFHKLACEHINRSRRRFALSKEAGRQEQERKEHESTVNTGQDTGPSRKEA